MYSRTSTSVFTVGPLLVCTVGLLVYADWYCTLCLSQICSTLSDLHGSMIGSAAVACLLVREGADPYCKGGIGKSPVEYCSEEIASHVLAYYGQRLTCISWSLICLIEHQL